MSKLETNQVDPATGTTLTLGTSGDTISIPSGVTIANSGTATGFGGTNTPAFIAYNSANQSIANTTYTTYQYNTEILDTDNGFDTSTYTYTVPSAGRYNIGAAAKKLSSGSTDRLIIRLEKNGSNIFYGESYSKDNASVMFNTVLNLSASDALKISIYQNTGGSVDMEGGSTTNVFYGFKIIE